MENNLKFFSHAVDASEHPKFKTLRAKYGWAGEGKFWALNGMIAKAEDCWLDLSRKFIKSSISCDLGFTIDEFDEYIKYLASDCELIIVEGDKISTKRLQETLAIANKKSDKYSELGKAGAEKRWGKDSNAKEKNSDSIADAINNNGGEMANAKEKMANLTKRNVTKLNVTRGGEARACTCEGNTPENLTNLLPQPQALEAPAAPPPPKNEKPVKEKFLIGEWVKLSKQEFKKLYDLEGFEIAVLAIKHLEYYKKYEKPQYNKIDHYAVINKWVVSAVKEKHDGRDQKLWFERWGKIKIDLSPIVLGDKDLQDQWEAYNNTGQLTASVSSKDEKQTKQNGNSDFVIPVLSEKEIQNLEPREDIKKEILELLVDEISENSIATWLDPMQCFQNGKKVYFVTNTEFCWKYVAGNYFSILKDALSLLDGMDGKELVLAVKDEED